MKLLILTQKVDINDDVLGFMHGWIIEFSKYYEKITVIALGVGEYNLPDNVKVLSLGKEKGESKLKYIINFYKYIWQERKNYDAVFVHMNQIYAVLGGLFWRLDRKKIGLWYAHKSISISLRIAEKIVDVIFTPSKESFRLISKKINITGHGINTDIFKPVLNIEKNKKFKIITVGRISPIKDYKVLIEAINIITKQGIEVDVKIIGGPGTPEQEKYFINLQKIVKEKKLNTIVNFVGSAPYREVANYFQSADLFINMSRTGSLDKTILEAMACGVITLSSNDSYKEILSDRYSDLVYKAGDFNELAKKIIKIKNYPEVVKNNFGEELRKIVEINHNLRNLIIKIINILGKK
jgi:glycosyltransferase involved in cell wall biosynthesis